MEEFKFYFRSINFHVFFLKNNRAKWKFKALYLFKSINFTMLFRIYDQEPGWLKQTILGNTS